MDARTLSPRTVKIIVAALAVLAAGVIVYLAMMKKDTVPPAASPAPTGAPSAVKPSLPPNRPGSQAKTTPKPADATQNTGSQTGWKTYKNNQYRFQIQVPGAYWYDAKTLSPAEKMANGSAVLKFLVSRPATSSAKPGTGTEKSQVSSDASKALVFLTMTVFDKKAGGTVDAKKAPEGVKATPATEVTMGGLKGMQFGKEAYVFENAEYRYEIIMTGGVSVKAIEDAFAAIVKTVKFVQ